MYESKYSKAQKQLKDQEEEENKGIKMRVNALAKSQKEEIEEDYIEEEIQSEYDNQLGNKLGESSGG